jgi:hypothetical protein
MVAWGGFQKTALDRMNPSLLPSPAVAGTPWVPKTAGLPAFYNVTEPGRAKAKASGREANPYRRDPGQDRGGTCEFSPHEGSLAGATCSRYRQLQRVSPRRQTSHEGIQAPHENHALGETFTEECGLVWKAFAPRFADACAGNRLGAQSACGSVSSRHERRGDARWQDDR